jgi:hypothetical protein
MFPLKAIGYQPRFRRTARIQVKASMKGYALPSGGEGWGLVVIHKFRETPSGSRGWCTRFSGWQRQQ